MQRSFGSGGTRRPRPSADDGTDLHASPRSGAGLCPPPPPDSSLQLPPPVRFHRPQNLVGNPRRGRLQPDTACPDGQRPSAPQRVPTPTPVAAYSPLVKGSIFPPPRLLTAEAPKLPTPRTEAALSTEHAQRGRLGLSGRCREGRRRSASLKFRCSGFLQQLQKERGRPEGKTTTQSETHSWERKGRSGVEVGAASWTGPEKPRPSRGQLLFKLFSTGGQYSVIQQI